MMRRIGFTLIELAIVVSIIAFIAGGIIAARSIVRTSQLQSIMGEYQMYAAAVKNFQSKYQSLPGDFKTATSIWGEVSASCTYDDGTGTGTKTCNGSGDGLIGMTTYEHITAWRHLGLSGFIPQNYSGGRITTSCNIDIQGRSNVPASKLKGAYWNIGASTIGTAYTTGAAGTQFFPMSTSTDFNSVHALWLGGGLQDDNAQAAGCALSQIPVMTGTEAFEIDVKYDDATGTAAGATTGKIRGQYNNTATYSTCELATSTRGAYRTSATGMNCSLVFLLEP